MGMIDRIIGMGGTATAVGTAASNVAEVFRENATRRMELDEEAYARAMAEHGAEFQVVRHSWFDDMVNGLNRLPRPLLTLGTMGLFGYSMVDPAGFSARMEGLGLVPEPLWWLMGAIVSFYFGARHQAKGQAFQREIAQTMASAVPVVLETVRGIEALDAAPAEDAAGLGTETNPALRDWRAAVAQDAG